MFVPGQNQLLANLSLLLFFKDLSIVRFYDFKKNFRGMCFTVQLSKIGFALPFVSNSFAIISCRFLPVKNFFQVFWLLATANGEGGIWTLAPLLTTCTLSRGVPSTSWVLLQIVDSNNLYNYRRHECLAERVGFEPTRPFGQTVFKTASLWPLRYLSECVS